MRSQTRTVLIIIEFLPTNEKQQNATNGRNPFGCEGMVGSLEDYTGDNDPNHVPVQGIETG